MLIQIAFVISTFAQANEPDMSFISGGAYEPFFERSKEGKKSSIIVEPFYLDKMPVTNEKFLEFVKKNPEWRRSKVKKVFAEANYLKDWLSDTKIPKKIAKKPVSSVSWFAANAYCESQGKVLPTVLQWEFVGASDSSEAYAMDKKSYKEKILKWYSRPSHLEVKNVASGPKNFWGVYDMHGLHWEWTLDFNTALVTGESREDSVLNNNLFCGSGSLGAKDKLDYGAFMRFGFRSSLKGNYTVGNLGFRCSK